jgi:hypothetical protein
MNVKTDCKENFIKIKRYIIQVFFSFFITNVRNKEILCHLIVKIMLNLIDFLTEILDIIIDLIALLKKY